MKWPSLSERNCATTTPFRSTVNPALNGALHAVLALHTGAIGPRSTVPVRPVVAVGAVAAPQPAVPSAATVTQSIHRIFVAAPRLAITHRPSHIVHRPSIIVSTPAASRR